MARSPAALLTILLCACTVQQPPVASHQGIALAPPTAQPNPSGAPIWVVTTTQAECREAPADGDTLYRLQRAINPLLAKAETDPSFGGAWIDYTPCYRLVLGFADGQKRQWLMDAAQPELRPLIAFARVPYSRSGQERRRTEIMAVLAKSGIKSVYFESPTERPAVGVMTEEHARLARTIIPQHYLDEIDIFVGEVDPPLER